MRVAMYYNNNDVRHRPTLSPSIWMLVEMVCPINNTHKEEDDHEH